MLIHVGQDQRLTGSWGQLVFGVCIRVLPMTESESRLTEGELIRGGHN